MKNNFLSGITFGLGILFVFSIIGLVSAVGFHYANEIIPGTFQTGNYIFDGNVNTSGDLIVEGNIYLGISSGNIIQIRNNTLNGTDFRVLNGEVRASKICDENGANCNDLSVPSSGSVPTGAIMAFNLVACPAGWSELVSARGRYIVGMPFGGTLASTIGNALSNNENRPTGLHNHAITDPGHSHTYPVDQDIWDNWGGWWAMQINYPKSVDKASSLSTTGITINNAGTVAGTNAPYIQLLYCQKN